MAIKLFATNSSYMGIVLEMGMFTNIKTSDNGWSNFTENFRVVAIKMLENSIFITKSISLLSLCMVLGSVVMLTFLN